MNNPFGISKEHLAWIKKIIHIHLPDIQIFAFGSRARGDFRKYSDLDLALVSKHPISKKILMEMEEHFSESDLPFKVDLIEFSKIDDGMQKQIQAEFKKI